MTTWCVLGQRPNVSIPSARILFDNLAMLDGDTARNRQAIEEFNQAVLRALETLA